MSGIILSSCNKDTDLQPRPDDIKVNQTQTHESQDVDVLSQGAQKKSPAIWADCEAFATIATPANFSPNAGNFDELYTGANFMNGMGAVSESKPGDQDYNGGRWHVNTLKPDVNPDKYNNVCSVDGIDPADFMSTDTYFECPLRPVRGNSAG